MAERKLDLITIGRASVDLYGTQVGGRLEDMGSFSKYIGGSPTNIAAGASRLGLRTALITRVGDEHFGRFIREQLEREGVNVRAVKTDPERLTALAILGIRDDNTFPLIFYRENCADMGLAEEDIDPEFISSARCVCATGTHLSHPNTEAVVLKAIRLARQFGARTALDIDFRPNLWGLAGHGEGESRFVASNRVTTKLQSNLDLFDLVVGTEEEFHIAGGDTDTIAALANVRSATAATLVCKRGPMGAVAFTGAIPSKIEDGESGEGFEVEVFNVLGAGDGFMAGLLKGWLTSRNWPASIRIANACGAFAVSRHGCTPSYPSEVELDHFLETGVKNPALRKNRELEQIHWATNRGRAWPVLRVFAFDHRSQFEEWCISSGASPERIGEFKQLCLEAALSVSDGRDGYGVLCDSRFGRDALHKAAGSGLWIGRPTELPGSRPIRLEPDLGADVGELHEWPLEQVVKVLCFCHPDDGKEMWESQLQVLERLFEAARRCRLETLLEVVPSKVGLVDDASCSTVVNRIYGAGLFPDWWKLEPAHSDAAWQRTCNAVASHDPHCRGIVLLGLDAPEADLVENFATAARHSLVKGFAVGRTIFGTTAKKWLEGQLDNSSAIEIMAGRFRALCEGWDQAMVAARRSFAKD